MTGNEPTDEDRRKHARIIKVIPGHDSMNAQRTSMDLPIIQKIIAAVKLQPRTRLFYSPRWAALFRFFYLKNT